MPPSDHEHAWKHAHAQSNQGQNQEKLIDNRVPLTTRESVELFQNAVDSACDEYLKKLKNEASGKTLKLKLTVDLRQQRLSQITKEVVEIIKQDVERYDMSR